MTTLEPSLPEGSDAAGQLGRLVRLAHLIDDDLHRIARELRPTALDDLGLDDTLLSLAEEWGEQAKVEVDYRSWGMERRRLPTEVETAVYRIVQEVLDQRAEARRRRPGRPVPQATRGMRVVVIVEDDGGGFDAGRVVEAAETAGRLGIRGMRERAALVGGDLDVESSPGGAPRSSSASPCRRTREGRSMNKLRCPGWPTTTWSWARASRPWSTPGPTWKWSARCPMGRRPWHWGGLARPDILVVDVSMPGMTGAQATQALKAELPEIKVLALGVHQDQS